MKLEASIQKSVGVSVQGLFGLRTLLQDHASEPSILQITKKASELYDGFRVEKGLSHFAPDFVLTKQKGANLSLEIRTKDQRTSVGVIPLKAKDCEGYQQLELIEEVKRPKRKPIKRVANGLRRSMLVLEMVDIRGRLSATCNEELSRFLDTKPSFEWSFDLDCNEEMVTVVAYWENQRTAVLSLFF